MTKFPLIISYHGKIYAMTSRKKPSSAKASEGKRKIRTVKKQARLVTSEIKKINLPVPQTLSSSARKKEDKQVLIVSKQILTRIVTTFVQIINWIAKHAWQLTKRTASIVYKRVISPVLSIKTYRNWFHRRTQSSKSSFTEFGKTKSYFNRLNSGSILK